MIKLTPRLHDTLHLAFRLHREQTRRDTERTPYSAHLTSVLLILGEYTDDEDILLAGLMHDSLEDVPGYTYEKLVADCGERVAMIVRDVTEIKEIDPILDLEIRWLKIRELYLENLKKATVESVMVSLADKIHNITTFTNELEQEGGEYLKRFHASPRNMLWFYDSMDNIAKERLGEENPLYKLFNTRFSRFKIIIEPYV
jgi:(p)ppGpp synthase/HD superfamily hydrolase